MAGTRRLRVPPGRAGRLWLRGRLDVARRGVDLLDRKLRILRREQERLALRARRSGEEWEGACRDAETWLLRAALLAGQRGLRLAGDVPPAEVTVRWTETMGIGYPADAVTAPGGDGELLPLSAALPPAAAAYRKALDAAVRHAATTAAARTVDEETAATRQRLRAVQDRWVPLLEGTLAALELTLDELERADGALLRRAAARGGGTGGGRLP